MPPGFDLSAPLQQIRNVAHSLIAVLGILMLFQGPVMAAVHFGWGVAYDTQTATAFSGIGAASVALSKFIDSRAFTNLNVANLWTTLHKYVADTSPKVGTISSGDLQPPGGLPANLYPQPEYPGETLPPGVDGPPIPPGQPLPGSGGLTPVQGA